MMRYEELLLFCPKNSAVGRESLHQLIPATELNKFPFILVICLLPKEFGLFKEKS